MLWYSHLWNYSKTLINFGNANFSFVLHIARSDIECLNRVWKFRLYLNNEGEKVSGAGIIRSVTRIKGSWLCLPWKTVYSATLSDKDSRPTPSHNFTQLNYFLSWFTKERKTAIIYYQCRFDENKIHSSDDTDQQNIKIKVLQIVIYLPKIFSYIFT